MGNALLKYFSKTNNFCVVSLMCAFGITCFSATATDKPAPAKTVEKVFDEKLLERIIENAAQKAADRAVQSVLKTVLNRQGEGTQYDSETPTTSQGGQSVADTSPMLEGTTQMMTIGTGVVGGNYFVLGELVGGVISHPTGSLPCGRGGTCGVVGLQTLNITAEGSMANINALSQGKVQSAFVQSDMAYWAYTGTEVFEGKEKMKDLRAIASLYPEAVHIVVRKDAKIKTVADLKDKRVSIGARTSGTLSQARLILAAYDLSEDDLKPHYLNSQESIEQLKMAKLDGIFFTVGAPAPALTQLFADDDDFTLLSIGESARRKILSNGYYFSPATISKETYPSVGKVETVSVYALWLCRAEASESLVYQMTKALWSKTSQQLFNSSYIGRQVNVDNSLQGIGIPLHKGAKKYYNEIGKRY